jgi:hypothetical protein
MNRLVAFAIVVIGFLAFATVGGRGESRPSADETARFLAGMPLPEDSPLAKAFQDASAKQHRAHFDAAFEKFEKTQKAPIRAWVSANLPEHQPVMYYLFGGPDFLYADAFFPNAKTYILVGLEPVGQVPDLTKLPAWTVAQSLRNLQGSLRSILSVSYFITKQMKEELSTGAVYGTLPILYVFLARTGKTIHDVNYVYLDETGTLQPGDGARARTSARGVKIEFSEGGEERKILYYFSANLGDERGRNAFLEYLKTFGQGDSMIKSASYMLHRSYFSQSRSFLLAYSKVLVEDDSGVPVAYFDPTKWKLQPFGAYLGPLNIFLEENVYQLKLAQLYQKGQPKRLEFGIGYQFRAAESNLLLAIKTGEVPETTATIPNATSRQYESDNAYARQQPQGPERPRDDRYWDDPFRRPEGFPPPPPFPFFLFGPR